MSKVQCTLALQIINDHFGDISEQVVAYLLQNGQRSLKDICDNVKISKDEVKKVLVILIQHNLVSFNKYKNKFTEYHTELHNIIRRRSFQRYIYIAKLKHGDIGELIIEKLLLNGCDTLSKVAKRVTERLEVDDPEEQRPDQSVVIKKCSDLISAHYLMRYKCLQYPKEGKKETKDINPNDVFLFPQGVGKKRKAQTKTDEPMSKKRKIDSEKDEEAGENEQYEDDGVYWYVNFERLDQDFNDQQMVFIISYLKILLCSRCYNNQISINCVTITSYLITRAVVERIDQSASKIVATLLKMTELERNILSKNTRSISIFDLIKKLPSTPRLDQQEVYQYLSLLSDEKTGGFVSKTDEAAGGMYSVNIQTSLEMICESVCSTIVMERFGSKACRVFRLLIQKRLLEQKQIGELAMIPFKDVKELLYKLFEESFLTIQEVSKTKDYAPSRSFYLFGVDMPQVSRLLLNRSYQAMGNLMLRRKFEMEENKRLLEKDEKIEGILAALSTSNEQTEQVIQELEELITPTEKEQLAKLKLDLARTR
nr:DNA-directed RNA polymerase III subunit RPC3 isoform X2 [Hydra vulgaris]